MLVHRHCPPQASLQAARFRGCLTHGADTSLTLTLLQAANPQLAIISVGSDNRFGHPAEVTVEKLQGIPTYRTDQREIIEVTSDGE